MHRFQDLTPCEISNRLENGIHSTVDPHYPERLFLTQFLTNEPRPASVLIPLLQYEDEWHILFTRRHPDLPEHSGQVSFPGGRMDDGDASPEETALREAWEEIGLRPGDVTILGRLHEFLTITNYLVTPVVGVIPWPYPLHLSEEEVSRAFTIPLAWLADRANYEERPRIIPGPFPPIPVIYFHPYDGEILWGATARFTLSLLNTLEDRT